MKNYVIKLFIDSACEYLITACINLCLYLV
jgi:hypothetical protein